MKNQTSTGKEFVNLCSLKRQTSLIKMQEAFPMLEYMLPRLPGIWTWASLSEICERVSVGHVGSTTPYFVPVGEGIPFIRSQDVRPGKLMLENTAYISQEFHQKLKKSQLKSGDVLIVRVGANRGDVCIVPYNVGEINCANIIFARPMCPNKFIGYYLQSEFGHELLLSVTTGSAQGVINTQTIARIPVPVPPLTTQKKIAGILSAYDDLIENNTRRIKILEEMAQTFYHEWLVKFRFPGHEHTKMVDSELGLIPEGWEVKQLGNIAQEIRRSIQPDAIDLQTPYLGLEHLPRKSIALSEWGNAGQVRSTKLIFKKGEILFGKIRPYFHKVGVAPITALASVMRYNKLKYKYL